MAFWIWMQQLVVILANWANQDSGGSVDQIRWMYLFGFGYSNSFAPIALWILSNDLRLCLKTLLVLLYLVLFWISEGVNSICWDYFKSDWFRNMGQVWMEVHFKPRRALSSVRGPFEYSLLRPFTSILISGSAVPMYFLWSIYFRNLQSRPHSWSWRVREAPQLCCIGLLVACWILGLWCSRGFIASLHLLHFGVQVQLWINCCVSSSESIFWIKLLLR
jgi:hypothetical protein